MKLLEGFRSAGRKGVEFRGVPFWSWNDDLDPGEIRRQLREMSRVGLGGGFMHARIGLLTSYLGTRWMECVRSAVDEAKKTGSKAWLYDEDKWPSGSGGGLIPERGADYQQKQLKFEEIRGKDFSPNRYTVAVFVGKKQENTFLVRRVPEGDVASCLRPGEKIFHFYYSLATQYVDLLSEKVTRAFISSTYELYDEEVGREFGRTIPGIFTDEPNYSFVPWSFDLPEFFRERKGYDVRNLLPALFGEYGDSRKLRYDFWSIVTTLFVNSFTRVLYEWCERHNLSLTGHFVCEDSLGAQVQHIGSAMRHYEFMQIPGIDHLGRFITDPVLCKQVSSVARQFRGRRVLSETFGCSGWNVSFEELKWIAEWQIVQGVDLLCQHLCLYSSKGCRKRDYPPSLFYQQPWWEKYRVWNDYFARLLFMLRQGTPQVDILVIHPIESAWCSTSSADMSEVDKLNKSLVDLTVSILSMQKDFDFGDEDILSRHARVEKCKLRVGSSVYTTVILPPLITIRRTTLELLREFVERGGYVLYQGSPPERVEGSRSEEPRRVYRKFKKLGTSAASIAKALEPVKSPVILKEKGKPVRSVYVQHRSTDEAEILFLTNTDRRRAHTCTAELRVGVGRAEVWDCKTGETLPLPVKTGRQTSVAELHFEPMGSHLIVLRKKARPASSRRRALKSFRELLLPDTWQVRTSDPNSITLDYCRIRVGGGRWQRLCHTIHLDDKLHYHRTQIDLALKFEFLSDFSGKPPVLTLVMEEPSEYNIEFNGAKAEVVDQGWWRDIAFRRVALPNSLKQKGLNELVLMRPYTGSDELRKRAISLPRDSIERNRCKYGVELESVYLLGDFSVCIDSPVSEAPRNALITRAKFTLRDPVSSVKTGDLTTQGFPFYCGYVDLVSSVELRSQDIRSARSILLKIPPPDAVVTEVLVNERKAGVRGWRPYEFEVKPYLKPADNTIIVRLYSSCRNLLGPHHHIDGELYFVGPASFTGQPSWTDTTRHTKSTWTDSYCFVKFGLTGSPVLQFLK